MIGRICTMRAKNWVGQGWPLRAVCGPLRIEGDGALGLGVKDRGLHSSGVRE